MKETRSTIWIIVIIVAALFLLMMFFTGIGSNRFYGMSGGYSNYGWGMMGGIGWIFMLLFSVALILLIIWLLQQIHINNLKERKNEKDKNNY